eukprot:5251536-Amphidinium_carterae.1
MWMWRDVVKMRGLVHESSASFSSFHDEQMFGSINDNIHMIHRWWKQGTQNDEARKCTSNFTSYKSKGCSTLDGQNQMAMLTKAHATPACVESRRQDTNYAILDLQHPLI